jgi:hypothetical protein
MPKTDQEIPALTAFLADLQALTDKHQIILGHACGDRFGVFPIPDAVTWMAEVISGPSGSPEENTYRVAEKRMWRPKDG